VAGGESREGLGGRKGKGWSGEGKGKVGSWGNSALVVGG